MAKRKKDNIYPYDAGSTMYNNDKLLNDLIFGEGLVYKTSTNIYVYEYHLKDHLGNEWYDPFGMNPASSDMLQSLQLLVVICNHHL